MLKIVSFDHLLQGFLTYFSTICNQVVYLAVYKGEPVLLCIHGYGDDLTFRVEIDGERECRNPSLQISYIFNIIKVNLELRLTMLLMPFFVIEHYPVRCLIRMGS